MTERDDNDVIAGRAKRLFDDSVEQLDANALSRLNRGRHAALAELASGESRTRLTRWVPVTGAVAAVLVAAVVLRGPDGGDTVTDSITATDFEMLLDEESLEMLEELEFYSWLDDADLDGNGNVG